MISNYFIYASKLIKEAGAKMAMGIPKLGVLYTYRYHPKYYRTLPYYDLAPLVVIIAYTKKGFYGLNFHYLPTNERKALIYMMQLTLKGGSLRRMGLFFIRRLGRTYWSFCLKRYLWSHVQGKMLYIPNENKDYALNFPIFAFKKINQSMLTREFLRRKPFMRRII